ncbi:MAG: hypothetical protein SCJ94_04665, partial [Bacillota bacterium]|nr:hypothetical protein [Bacillota bacterium]
MNKGKTTELIKAKDYSVPFNVWEYTPLDRACIKMVIRGTWIFETRLDVKLMKDTLAKTLSHYPRLAGIPSNYAGNSSLTIATPDFSAEAGFYEIASIIEETLEPFRQSPSLELMKLMQLNLNTMKHKLSFAPFNIFGMFTKKPTIAYLNNFSKLHIYDIDFGSGEPIRVIPHDLHDQVVIWPAPSAKGGVEVYFS